MAAMQSPQSFVVGCDFAPLNMQISIDTWAYKDPMHVCFNLQEKVDFWTYAVCSCKSSKEGRKKRKVEGKGIGGYNVW